MLEVLRRFSNAVATILFRIALSSHKVRKTRRIFHRHRAGIDGFVGSNARTENKVRTKPCDVRRFLLDSAENAENL